MSLSLLAARLRPWLACLVLIAAPALRPATAAADPLITAWCQELGQRLRSVEAAHCQRQPFVADTLRTPGQRPLVWLDLAPAAPVKRAPGASASATAKRVLVIGGIHGDELTSVSIVFRWLDWIADPAARPYHWRLIPVANPDGLHARPSTRVNARGVDLNRNFRTRDWDERAHTYWAQRTKKDPRRHPGASAGSEAETRWLEQQIADFRPDLIISVHAPYNLLDYDGPAPEPMRFGRLTLNRLGVYPGSLGNYAGLERQIPVITIELPSAGSMPALREQRQMWQDMLGWMRKNIPVADKP